MCLLEEVFPRYGLILHFNNMRHLKGVFDQTASSSGNKSRAAIEAEHVSAQEL